MSREVSVSDTEELWNGKLYRVFLAPARVPSLSPVQEMTLSGSAGAVLVPDMGLMCHSILRQPSPASPARGAGGSRCWGEGLAGAPGSSSSILCLKLLLCLAHSQVPEVPVS